MTNYIGLTLKGFQGQIIDVISFFEKLNMYQCKETKNNIVGSPLLSESDIKELIEAQKKINQSENIMQELKEKEEQQKQQEQQEYENVYGYCDNMTQLQKGKILTTLNKTARYNKKVMTRKEFVKTLLDQGYELIIIDKMVSSDRKINLERVVKYKYNVPSLQKENEFYTITKTEYDYALYLQSLLVSN